MRMCQENNTKCKAKGKDDDTCDQGYCNNFGRPNGRYVPPLGKCNNDTHGMTAGVGGASDDLAWELTITSTHATRLIQRSNGPQLLPSLQQIVMREELIIDQVGGMCSTRS